MTRARETEMVERLAEAIYALMPYDEKGVKPKWVPHGNSFKQDEARGYARAALEAMQAAGIVLAPYNGAWATGHDKEFGGRFLVFKSLRPEQIEEFRKQHGATALNHKEGS